MLTTQLGYTLLVQDLKNLNAYIQDKSTDADVEFLDNDDSVIDLNQLRRCLSSSQQV